MNELEEKEYKKALEVIKAYPDAIRTIIKYHSILELNSDINNELGSINLTLELSKRTANILKKYFDNTYNFEIDLYKFPIKLFNKINLSKLKMISNCGVVSANEIEQLMNKYNFK